MSAQASFSKIRRGRIKRKISLGFIFIFFLAFLVFFGWVVKNDFKIGDRSLVIPVGEKNIEKQTEIRLKNFAFEENLILSKVQLEDEGRALMAVFSGELICLFTLEKEIESQLASLQFILWRAKMEGKSLKTVDLRFDKPVVKY